MKETRSRWAQKTRTKQEAREVQVRTRPQPTRTWVKETRSRWAQKTRTKHEAREVQARTRPQPTRTWVKETRSGWAQKTTTKQEAREVQRGRKTRASAQVGLLHGSMGLCSATCASTAKRNRPM